MTSPLPAYAELHCLSNFSFLRGASHAEELVERAHALGYSALAITDECSLAGVVKAHVQAKALGMKLIIGSEFRVEAPHPFTLVLLAPHRQAYAQLSAFITQLRQASPKGHYRLTWDALQDSDLATRLSGCLALWIPQVGASWATLFAQAQWAARTFAGRIWLSLERLQSLDDAAWLARLRELSHTCALPMVASGDVHMHVRSRKPLQDVLTATRLNQPLRDCGLSLQANAERHLRSRLRLARLYPPDLLAATVDIAQRCHFSLDELHYEYPDEVVPAGHTPSAYLRQLTLDGARTRYPDGLPGIVARQIEHELSLIAELDFERYFLTVHDIVRFARSRDILCQGRGSAANSAVCYCLGITEVDPSRANLLFERFISKERHEPPDIDVDFEHQRREEVIQYLYGKYGRHRTALAATVITYRTRSAVRDVGRALGMETTMIERLAKSHFWWDSRAALSERLSELGLDPESRPHQLWFELTQQLIGFPRHLSQHVGGFVIARGQMSELVPIENAAMPERSVIQWDKNDLESLKLMKVDVLSLGMLSAIRRSLAFASQRRGLPPERALRMQDIPDGDPDTYAMIRRADTVGVFQIESRAQMSMLPRLAPERFYDLVVQVAIVRPGPIQGGMVHPYLLTRQLKRAAPYPALLEAALARTNGIPIFQEQVMQIVVLGAGFTPGEADQLRRAMAAWKRKGGLEPFRDRIIDGLSASTGDAPFAGRIFEMLKGFGEYGFPESHAASFALLAYVSAWLKCHEPAAFLAGLLNAQPMGFYSPSQLVQDAKRHGVSVRPVDVSHSQIESHLEGEPTQPAVRLGLHLISGLSSQAATRIVQARQAGPFASMGDLARRAALDAATLRTLASADALQSLAGHRRQQVWEATGLQVLPALLKGLPVHEAALPLPAASEGEEIVFDHAATGLSLRRHPLALLRPTLLTQRLMSAEALRACPHGRLVRACGIVTLRQQPGTAKGVIFLSLEDETGTVNVVVWPSLRDRQRAPLLHARLLAVHGRWQNVDGVHSLVAGHLQDLSHLLGRLGTHSRDFH